MAVLVADSIQYMKIAYIYDSSRAQVYDISLAAMNVDFIYLI